MQGVRLVMNSASTLLAPAKPHAAARQRAAKRSDRRRIGGAIVAAAGVWTTVGGFVNPTKLEERQRTEVAPKPRGHHSSVRRTPPFEHAGEPRRSSPNTAVATDETPARYAMLLAAIGLGSSTMVRAGNTARADSGAGTLVVRPPPGSRLIDADSSSSADMDQWLPRILLFLFAVFCSTNFTLVKVLESNHSEAAVAAMRFAVALIPFLPMIPKHLNWVSITSGVEIGLWCAMAYISQGLGLQHTEASKGAFLCSLAMVVVPIVKSAFGHQVRPQIWGSVVLAVAGTALLVGLGGGAGSSSIGGGECLCALTAVGFGLMFARMDEHAKNPEFDPLGCTIWQVITLSVVMAAWLLLTAGPLGSLEEVTSILSGGPQVLAALAWVGIVTTAGVLYVETWAMEKVDGAEAGVIFASEPVWATLFASAVLGETFGMQELGGGALILLACLLTQLQLNPETKEGSVSA